MMPSSALQSHLPQKTLHKISFRLLRPGRSHKNNDWRVETIYCKTQEYSQTLNFGRNMTASDLLHSRFWEALRTEIAGESKTGSRLNSSFSLELPGLSLKQIQLSSHFAETGDQRVMVVCHKVFGGLAQLFAPGKTPSSLDQAQGHIATRVLEDLIRPTLDLCNIPADALKQASAEILQKRLKALKGKHDDLDFYATLLTRFIAQQAEIGACHDAKWVDIANYPVRPGSALQQQH